MNKDLQNLLDLDFDQFGRIYAAKNAIEEIRKKNEKLKILDVGGYKGNTVQLFPKDDVLIIDQYNIKDKNYLKANALNLPFKDDEFDAVVSFDVFEHIKPKDRNTYLLELTRVAKTITIIAAPFKSRHVENAERLSNDYYRFLSNKEHPWLIEHIENTLPETRVIENFLKKRNYNYEIVNNNNVFTWNYLQHAVLLSSLGKDSIKNSEVNKFYNLHLEALEDQKAESYRKIYLISKKNKLKIKKSSSKEDSLIVQMELTDKVFREIAQIILDKNKIIANQNKTINLLKKQTDVLLNSISWKVTKPLRKVRNLAKKKK